MSQNRVLVLFSDGSEAMPCHPARARQLLDAGKGAVYRHQPFTIILTDREDGETQDVSLQADPGSQTTGLALVGHFQEGNRLIWAANLQHRGDQIKEALRKRRQARRSRRSRNTRYRKPRFDNRTKPDGWLPPSVQSRVDNIREWAKRLTNRCPIAQIKCETVRFDTQKIQDPEIEGTEYQHGTLKGYELREYLLQKFDHSCVYCGATDVPLEIDHVRPKSQGGSDRASNLVVSCVDCNREKGSQPAQEFVEDEEKLDWIKSRQNETLKDTGVMNSIRWKVGETLEQIGLPVSYHTGGETKYNRTEQGYRKDHWTDAACVGEPNVYIPKTYRPLKIRAEGRGSRQMCRMDANGFPRTSPKQQKRVDGFQTGDLVRAVVPEKYKTGGTHVGKVTIRSRGSFDVNTADGRVSSINSKHCELLQRADGYSYSLEPKQTTHSSFG
jgi:5-methylcytosine-specific restriction endonuclease McrA